MAIIHPADRLADMSSKSEDDQMLRERYGRDDKSFLRSWKAPALFFAIVGGSWLLWSANHAANPAIRSTLISFTVSSDTAIEIRYSLAIDNSEKAHECRLVARDGFTNIVGEVTDLIPAGSSRMTRSISIPTRLKAVNAGISGCRTL